MTRIAVSLTTSCRGRHPSLKAGTSCRFKRSCTSTRGWNRKQPRENSAYLLSKRKGNTGSDWRSRLSCTPFQSSTSSSFPSLCLQTGASKPYKTKEGNCQAMVFSWNAVALSKTGMRAGFPTRVFQCSNWALLAALTFSACLSSAESSGTDFLAERETSTSFTESQCLHSSSSSVSLTSRTLLSPFKSSSWPISADQLSSSFFTDHNRTSSGWPCLT